MGKALKTVGVIIGGAALIATGVGALAMPALAGSTTLFGVSVGTLNTISSGLIAVGGFLDKPKSQGSASPDEWTSNPDQPIPFLMGRMGVAGKIVQRDEFGPDNMYQGIVGIISGAGPIRGVNAFAGDKQPVTFGANGIATSSQWQGEMWMVRRSGAQPDTVLTVPSGLKPGGDAFEWTSAAKLSGKACYLQVLGENSKGTAYPAGIPDPVHDAEGIYGYDPRYDDSYPGGAGPCRLGVRSTYRWIEDGGIGALNWALGLVENGQVVGGIGASVDGIDIPAFVEVANIADANGWKLAAWPDTSEDASAVLDQLLQAAGAVRARHAGKISCVSRGAPRASVATITARDTAGDIELDTAPSLFNRLNTITPRFMSEAAGWVLTPANPVSFAQYVTDDGGKHGDQIDYRFVPLLKQAAELAAYDILDAREPFSGTIPLKAHMRHLKRGDTFLVSEPGFLMDGVKCIVLSRSYDPKSAQVRIGFRSETDSKHALALGKTTTLPAFPVLTPTDPTLVSPPLPEDWTVVVTPPVTIGGGQVPGFELTGAVSNATATGVLVEWGLSADGPWTQAYLGPPTVETIPITGVQPGGVYYIAVSYIRDQNTSQRQVYGPYTAPELAADISPDNPIWAQLDANTRGLLQNAIDDLHGLFDEEERRDVISRDILDRLDLGFEIDPVERTALVRIETLFEGVGPGGLPETLVQTTLRLSAVDALNAAATAQALIDARAHTDAYKVEAALTFATQAGLGSAISAARGEWQSYANAAAAGAVIGLATNAALDASIASARGEWRSYADASSANAVVGLVSGATLATAFATAQGQWESYATAAAAGATAGLVTGAALAASLATARGQWESFATAAAASAIIGLATNASLDASIAAARGEWRSYADAVSAAAVIGLVSGATLATSLATAKGQWEAFATAEAARAVVGLDTVAARESALAIAKGQWESFATAAAASATIGLVTGASLAGSLATAKSQWESYATAAAASATAGLDTVAAREGAVAATVLALQSYTNNAVTASAATLATQTSLNGVSAVASLALSTANGNEAYAALWVDVGGALTGLRINGVDRSVAIKAVQILFGDNTVFDDPTDTLTTTLGTRKRVIAWGAAFGAAADLLEWYGPASVALGAMTTSNGHNGRMTTAPYAFDNVIGAASFVVSVPAAIHKTVVGGTGTITTSPIAGSVTGATGVVTWTWTNGFGDPDVSVFGGSTATPTFSGNPVGVSRKQALFAYSAADSGTGITRYGSVAVTINRDA